ncbi:unnamed protein product [Spodoptera exigua]|nr:unnamed protein product [Spodoptera exigua]
MPAPSEQCKDSCKEADCCKDNNCETSCKDCSTEEFLPKNQIEQILPPKTKASPPKSKQEPQALGCPEDCPCKMNVQKPQKRPLQLLFNLIGIIVAIGGKRANCSPDVSDWRRPWTSELPEKSQALRLPSEWYSLPESVFPKENLKSVFYTARSVPRATQRANRPPQTGPYRADVQPGLRGKSNEAPPPRPRAGEGTGDTCGGGAAACGANCTCGPNCACGDGKPSGGKPCCQGGGKK